MKEQQKTDGAAQELLSTGQVVSIPVDQLASANKNVAPQRLEEEIFVRLGYLRKIFFF